MSVEVVRKPKKPVPEKVAELWAAEWAKEGKEVDCQRLMPPSAFRVLGRRWVVERTFAWISHNRRMAKDYERLCATGEAFVPRKRPWCGPKERCEGSFRPISAFS